jgi:hypothetical protein
MSYLAVALVLVAALALGNLALTLAVLSRLRTQPGPGATPDPGHRILLGPGESPAEFRETDLTGEPLDRTVLAGALVGFFSPACEPCRERMPEFVAHARALGLAADRVLAVLVGDWADVAALATELADAARVAVEPPDGPLQRAFDVRGLPAICLLDDAGTVVASGTDLVTFPVTVAR